MINKILLALFLFVVTTTSVLAVSEDAFDEYIGQASAQTGVDRNLIKSILRQETQFIDKYVYGDVLSSAGAVGAMQLMPTTAAELEPKGFYTVEKLKDPAHNIMAGALYLKKLIDDPRLNGDMLVIMAAYNSGPNNRYTSNGRIPPYSETVNYVRKASEYYAQYAGSPPLDLSSVPPPGSGTIPGGGSGTLPIYSTPSISSNSAEVLSKFAAYTGISANTLSGLLGGILGTLAFIFFLIQIILFWKEAYTQGDGGFEALWGSLFQSLRTLLVVSILFIFVT